MTIIRLDLILARSFYFWQPGHKPPTRKIGLSWCIWCDTSEEHTNFHLLSVPTEVEILNDGWMHRLQSILIWEDIWEGAYIWYVYSQLLDPQNRSSTWKFLLRQKLWALVPSCQISAGPEILFYHKATVLRIVACTSTTRVPLFWIITGGPWVAKGQSTLTFGVFLSLIGLRMVKCQKSGFPQGIWLVTTWPNLFKVICSGSSETKSWSQGKSKYNIL